MQLYKHLSALGFLKKSYAFKFLFVAFVGIHIPLIGLIFFVLFSEVREDPMLTVLFTLIMTLLATAVTLIVLRKLTWPVRVAARQLEEYRVHGTMPDLPRNFQDEAGILMSNVQKTIEENHDLGNEKLDLIYLLSHDLHNFAANSQALARLIAEEEKSDPVRQYASLIVDSTEQQLLFLGNFIRLIRDEEEIARRLPIYRSVPIAEVLAELNKEKGNELSKKALALVIENNAPNMQLPIDFDLLMRVLANLLDNAIKFSDRGSCIRLNFYEDTLKSYISVEDEGMGFEPSHSDILFRKFTPMSRKGTEGEPSTGIGLYLCRKIIEKYEGKLLAESRGPHKGSKFTILFATQSV